MRPWVSVLLSWQPAPLATVGHDLVRRSADLQRQAGDLTAIDAGLSAVRSGAAAQAATTRHMRRSAEVDELATVVHTAGQALLRAEAIGHAGTSLQSALSAASAARCTVLDDGTVLLCAAVLGAVPWLLEAPALPLPGPASRVVTRAPAEWHTEWRSRRSPASIVEPAPSPKSHIAVQRRQRPADQRLRSRVQPSTTVAGRRSTWALVCLAVSRGPV